MTIAALATQYRPASSRLTNLSLANLYELSKVLVGTGFLPAAIRTPEQCLAIMLKGQELRIPPMAALSNIAVIQGKPVASSELMLALIYRDHGDDAIVFTETSVAGATISYRRRGWRERRTFSFTAQDATTAGLSGQNWTKYRPAMLRARCISAVARLAFPDSIGGMYLPEELGADVDPETGEILRGWPPDPLPHEALAAEPMIKGHGSVSATIGTGGRVTISSAGTSAATLGGTLGNSRTVVDQPAAAEPEPDHERELLVEAWQELWDKAQAAGVPVRVARDVDPDVPSARLLKWINALDDKLADADRLANEALANEAEEADEGASVDDLVSVVR